MSDDDVKLPFGMIEIDWSLQQVHTTGSLVDYRKNWEQIPMHSEHLRRFVDVLGTLLPPEQGRYAICGGFAYNAYNVPRETQDIDVAIVFAAFDAIEAPLRQHLEPEFEFRRTSGQTFVHRGNEKVADLVFAETNPVLFAALRHPRGTRVTHVPRLGNAWCIAPEAFIVSKFYSASETQRGVRRFGDVQDLLSTIKEKENQPLDGDLMRAFARLVPIMGAAEAFERIVAGVAAGKMPRFPWNDDEEFFDVGKFGPPADGP